MKPKNILFLISLFLLFNLVVYTIVDINKKDRIKSVLNDKLKSLQTHYKVLLYSQKTIALAAYKSTINNNRVIQIISKANSANKEEKKLLRDELKELLSFAYEVLKKEGVLQYQFLLPNNESFLRMHKRSKFGDDLTSIRDDFSYTNSIKKPVSGFTQGRTAHGFRNTFPIFDNNGTHIGAMEVSFSSDSFQWYLNHISNIHTHLIVDKNIFNAQIWTRDDMILKYTQSEENENYMLTLGKTHIHEKCIIENKVKLKPIKEEIRIKMLKGKMFSLYINNFNNIEVISFLPIKNLKYNNVAWLVSYEETPCINLILKNGFIIKLIGLFISVLFIYFIAQLIYSKRLIEKRKILLDDILNLTDNIIFITDFKNVSFSNNKFKNFLNIKHTKEFNIRMNHNVLKIFIPREGYLHEGLLNKNKSLIVLFKKTPEDKRIVIISDKYFQEKIFKIHILKIHYNNDYLITLSDITQLKAKQTLTEKKAYIDGLTGVYNRNKFDEILEDELRRTKRYKHPLSIAIIDIDKFKDVNDTYGHLIGDEILIMLAQSINNNVRDTDTFARWGGEEFVILFKETTVQNAYEVCKNLKKIIVALTHPTVGSITVSFGLTEHEANESMETMFIRCDKALYLAKENGRNRIEVL
ncbi:MAG: diguanylate cyclase [Campylobacterota bacterium]|nr:diguanylate cyclase [Campylobacterota bacterium]